VLPTGTALVVTLVNTVCSLLRENWARKSSMLSARFSFSAFYPVDRFSRNSVCTLCHRRQPKPDKYL
jgi:hypothetical protein